jgi:choline kinase
MLNSLNIHSHLYHFLLNKIINGENEMNLIGEICLLNNFNSENNIYTIFKLKRYIFNEFILNSSVNVWNDGENKSRSQAQSQNVLYPLLTVFHK